MRILVLCLIGLLGLVRPALGISGHAWVGNSDCTGNPVDQTVTGKNNTCHSLSIPSPFVSGTNMTVSYIIICKQLTACSSWNGRIWFAKGCGNGVSQPLYNADAINSNQCVSRKIVTHPVALKITCGSNFDLTKCTTQAPTPAPIPPVKAVTAGAMTQHPSLLLLAASFVFATVASRMM